MFIRLPSLVFLNQNFTPCLNVGSTLSAATLTVHQVLLSSASVLTRGIMIHAHAQLTLPVIDLETSFLDIARIAINVE